MRMRTTRTRPGSVIPLAALLITVLLGFLALVLDIGVMMISRTECQNAADAAALAGARTLNGDTSTNNNYANVTPNARAAAAANKVFGKPINTSAQLTVKIGDYYYNPSTRSFQVSASGLGLPGDNWSLVQATVSAQQPTLFAKVLGATSLSAAATATAVHRPRDVVIVVDFSGSMR